MFDLITGKTKHMPSGGPVSVLLSSVLHAIVVCVIVTVPMLFVTYVLPPEAPAMMAFVAAPPPAPPPPPPPPPRVTDAPPKAVTSNVNAFPVEAPSHIDPEPAETVGEDEGTSGVEGGLAGGVVGGIVGGLEVPPPPPPPPPPLPPPQQPVRIGGDIHPPTLLRRVEPTYPELALRAHVEGTVILEAIIDDEGTVQSVKVLRSVQLLDQAAVSAVEQWHYSPVMLNGRPVRAVLTVVLSFKIPVI